MAVFVALVHLFLIVNQAYYIIQRKLFSPTAIFYRNAKQKALTAISFGDRSASDAKINPLAFKEA